MDEWKSVIADVGPDRFHCEKCGSDKILYREIDEIYEDYRYKCEHCGNTWVVEGADY